MNEKNFFKTFLLSKKGIWSIVWQCCFSLIESGLAIFLIYKIASLTDFVVNHDYDKFINALPISFFAIIMQVISYYLEQYMKIKCKAEFSNNVRNLIGNKIIHTPLSLKEKYSSANILSVFNNEIELIQDYVGNIAGIAANPIIAIVSCIYFANISYKLLIVSCVLIPVSTVVYNRLSKPIQRKTRGILDEKSKLNTITKDVISGFYVMKAFGLQRYFLDKYSNQVNTIANKEKEKDKMNSILGRIFILLRYIPQLIIPLYGGYLSFSNEITLGQLIASNVIIWYIISPIESFLDIIKGLREIKPALQDIHIITKFEQEENIQANFGQANDEIKEIGIHHLSFKYDESNILNNINLELNRKDHVKIIGESGAGKSTLLKIICGLYTKFQGNINVRGVMLTSENAASIRKLISYVPQHPYIFRGTIEENISMGKNVSRQYVIKAAKLAYANEFIEALPDGYDTLVGSGGVKLSGGQCKRLAIARAVIKNGSIFIFDEPTSMLDLKSEEKVKEGFYKICNGKCSIIVTHRMGIVDDKDKIMILNRGNLYEQ